MYLVHYIRYSTDYFVYEFASPDGFEAFFIVHYRRPFALEKCVKSICIKCACSLMLGVVNTFVIVSSLLTPTIKVVPSALPCLDVVKHLKKRKEEDEENRSGKTR